MDLSTLLAWLSSSVELPLWTALLLALATALASYALGLCTAKKSISAKTPRTPTKAIAIAHLPTQQLKIDIKSVDSEVVLNNVAKTVGSERRP